MENVIIDLFDGSNGYIIDNLLKRSTYHITGIIPMPYCLKQMQASSKFNVPICAGVDRRSVKVDRCILLQNLNIKSRVAFEKAKNYIQSRISVDCYFTLSDEQIQVLKAMAEEYSVAFEVNECCYVEKSLSDMECNEEVRIPVIYISGLDERCDLFATHLLVDSILREEGFKVVNITNSVYGKLFDYIPMYSLFDPKTFNAYTTISYVKKHLFDLIRKTKGDIMVISNMNNFIELSPFVMNYGFDNYILKNTVDFDYVIYNVPINFKDQVEFLKKSVLENTNTKDIFIGMAHVFLDKYIDNNYYFVPTDESEYANSMTELRLRQDLMDPLLKTDIIHFFNNN